MINSNVGSIVRSNCMNANKKILITFNDDDIITNYECVATDGTLKFNVERESNQLRIEIPNDLESRRISISLKNQTFSGKMFYLILPVFWVGVFSSGLIKFDEFGWPYDYFIELEVEDSSKVDIQAPLALDTPFKITGSSFEVIKSGLIRVKGHKTKWFMIAGLPLITVLGFLALLVFLFLVSELSSVLQFTLGAILLAVPLSPCAYLIKVMTRKVLNN